LGLKKLILTSHLIKLNGLLLYGIGNNSTLF
jgi:hypothetical protein